MSSLVRNEYRLGHGAGGVVHGDEQRQFRSPVLQPGMVAAVDLHQHALLGHASAPEPVLLGAAAARTADAGLSQMRRTVGRLRSMLSRSRSSSVKWLWLAPA